MGSSGPKRLATTPERQLYADPAAAAAQSLDKIAAARVWLLKEKPFFGVLARALVVEPTLAVRALRLTPDDRLLENPIAVLELGFPALCGRIAHVAMHAALGAHVRRGTREALRWNAAHDLAITPLLQAAGLGAPPVIVGEASAPEPGPGATGVPGSVRALHPGASAEEHYLALPEGARPADAWCDLADPPPPPGPPPVAGTYTRQDDGTGDDSGGGGSEKGDANGEQSGDAKRSGSTTGAGDEDDDEDDDANDDAPLAPASSVAPAEARGRELQWKMRLAAALEEERASGGKTFGEWPAWIDELVRATIEPPPDWAATLQRSVSMLARTHRSFLRPSRRMSALAGPGGEWPDLVSMPGRRVEPAGRLVAVVDTSASIAAGTIARFLGALASVATAEGFDEVRLVQADAEVTCDETVLAAELLFQPIAIVGRGGTDFGPALRRLSADARRQAERFTVAYLTDLGGRFPAPHEAHGLEVLWVVAGTPAEEPPFGRVLVMAPERAR